MITYKIVEKVSTGGYKFLFHRRKITFNDGDVLIAEKKMVYEAYNKDGSKKLYLSGIHVIETLELCIKYLKRFKDKSNKVIIECNAIDFVKKPKGNPGVLLADKITIIKEVNYEKN